MARFCFVQRVRPDRLEEYRRRHAEVWPEMLRALADTGWRDYRLYLSDDGLLVGQVECDDLQAALARMSSREVNARWQESMAPYFVSGENPDEGFVVLDQIFHLEEQLDRVRGDETD